MTATYQIVYHGKKRFYRAYNIYHAIRKFQERNKVIVHFRFYSRDDIPFVQNGWCLVYGQNFKHEHEVVDISLVNA